MNNFRDFNIPPKVNSFVGEKIQVQKLFNLPIKVITFKIGPSKQKDGTELLTLQIEKSGEKRIVFTGSTVMMDQIRRVPIDKFPFLTTIKGRQRLLRVHLNDFQMKWTNKKLNTLRELYPTNSCRIIAGKIGCTYHAVKSKVNVLKLKHAPGYNRMAHSIIALTEEERKFIAANYTRYTNHELAAMIKRSESAIQQVRRVLGINKENFGRFKKGQRPWSFRTKGLVKSTPGMQRTQFKKGQLPKNTLQDGAITTRIEDRSGRAYKWIRVALGKWEMYHRWKWIQKNGPVPKGYLVIFKDGDTMNTDDSNLVLMSMGDNARRNYNPERAQRHAKDLSDKYIAGRMARGDKATRDALIKAAPELIDLKRKQLQLKRKLNYEKKHKIRKAHR